MVKVGVLKLSKTAVLPKREHDGDSGLDLFADENVVIGQGEWKLVGTGIALEMEKGIEAQVRPKSGLAAKHGITMLNSPGTIDSGYRGEVKVIVANFGKKPYRVEKGQKIAQLVFAKVESVELKELNAVSQTGRGSGGFGSTGL